MRILRALQSSIATAAVTGTLIGTGVVLGPMATANFGSASATTAVNVRTGPSTSTNTIGVLTPGQVVEQTGPSSDGWTPITYQGRGAWVSSQYLTAAQSLAAPSTPIGSAQARTAVNVREGRSVFTRILGTLAAGERVEVTGEAQGDWTPVRYRGRSGWVASTYLRSVGSPAPTPSPGGGSTTVTGTALANATVNVRSGPSTNNRIVGSYSQGATVQLRGDSANGWTPVLYNGSPAFVASRYLSVGQTMPAPAPAPAPTAPSTTQAWTTAPLNVRSGASTSSSVVTVLASGAEVALTGPTSNGYSQILLNGSLRWVYTTYLSATQGTTPTPTPPVTSPVAPALPTVIGTRYTTARVNVRTSPTISSTVLTVALVGTAVQITGTVQNGFAQVVFNNAVRWISVNYLSSTLPSTGNSSGLSGLTASSQAVVAATRANFPQIVTFYGVRADTYPDHPSGRAVDLMLPNWRSNYQLGMDIATYMTNHAAELNIDYVIYNQRIWSSSRAAEGWRLMADRGSDTANHKDHVHVSVKS